MSVAVRKLHPPPRRGLRRAEAASYVGLSPTKFDELVEDGRMPRAIRVDGCVVWDIHDLDAAFERLKDEASVIGRWDRL